jgi:hypothetical protein
VLAVWVHVLERCNGLSHDLRNVMFLSWNG